MTYTLTAKQVARLEIYSAILSNREFLGKSNRSAFSLRAVLRSEDVSHKERGKGNFWPLCVFRLRYGARCSVNLALLHLARRKTVWFSYGTGSFITHAPFGQPFPGKAGSSRPVMEI